jgi:hypothetical protein
VNNTAYLAVMDHGFVQLVEGGFISGVSHLPEVKLISGVENDP